MRLRKDKKEDSIAKKRNMKDEEDFTLDEDKPETNSSSSSTSNNRSYTISDIPELMAGIQNSANLPQQIQCLRGFRRLLSIEKNPPVQECIDIGAVPMFVEFLQRQDSMELQFESAWALTNIASTDRTKLVVECGAVPYLVQLLSSENADIREQCAWCLGNVAGDGADLRNIVMQYGALGPLVQNIMQPASLPLLRNCTWSLSNFCRGKPQPKMADIAIALPVLGQLVANNVDQDTTTDAVWALSYVSDGDDARIQHVIDLGITPNLVNMLSSQTITVVVPALRTLGNIVSGNDHQTSEVVRAGVLPILVPLLSHPRKNIRKETCWMLSNIAAGNEQQLDQLFNTPNLINRTLEQMSSSTEWEVRKEASWVISNIASAGKEKHIVCLVELGAIRPLCDLLNVGDSKILLVAMEALESILKSDNGSMVETYTEHVEEAGGLDLLEGLQEHENEEVYMKAVAIIEKYFGLEEEDEESENLAPAASASGNTFSFGMNTTGNASIDFGNQFMSGNKQIESNSAPPAPRVNNFQYNF